MEITKSLTHQCRYCQKQFQRERSLEVHLCEPKRRYQEQHTPGVRLGFHAYVKFYELTQGSAKLKTFDDFAQSQYYRAFSRWGNYCVDIRAINPEAFLTWLLKTNKKIDQWCSDKIYTEYLHQYIVRESANDAVKRSIEEITLYCDTFDQPLDIAHYFLYGNTNRICHHIATGRVSAWVVYNCHSGVEFIEKLPVEQMQIVMPWIDPTVWQKRFEDLPSDVEFTRHVLEQAGL